MFSKGGVDHSIDTLRDHSEFITGRGDDFEGWGTATFMKASPISRIVAHIYLCAIRDDYHDLGFIQHP